MKSPLTVMTMYPSQIEFYGTYSSGAFEGTNDINGLDFADIRNLTGLVLGVSGADYSRGSGYHIAINAVVYQSMDR